MYLNIEPNAPERAVCVPHGEFEPEALCDEEFEVKDVVRCSLRDVRRVLLERYGVVRRLRGEEQRGEPTGHGYVLQGDKMRSVTHITFFGCQSITVFCR